jgi:hypothetical protein
MDSVHRPQTCRWAEPTLNQAWPMWLDAWAWPWSCIRHAGSPRLVPATTDCESCAHWEPREPSTPPPITVGVTHGYAYSVTRGGSQ